jgi:glycosyltransferase involved in cell wall biosynthesis
MLGALWDQDLLNQLYAHCLSYIHGHSVGGTNPSLLRALGCGAPVTAFDVVFNREVTDGHASFFSDADEVAAAITADDRDPELAVTRGKRGKTHVKASYRWDDVATAYENLLVGLAQRQSSSLASNR